MYPGILDELGYLLFSQAAEALLFHLLSELYEHISEMITTNLDFAECSTAQRRPPRCWIDQCTAAAS